MVSYIPQSPKGKKLKVLGLMSGNGNIEEWIDSDKYDITAVEKDEYRCLSGSYICYHHFHQRDAVQWICSDIYDDEFIMKYIIPGNFDVVIMNPDFATRNSKYGDIVSSLPTTLLNIGKGRRKYYGIFEFICYQLNRSWYI